MNKSIALKIVACVNILIGSIELYYQMPHQGALLIIAGVVGLLL